MRIPAALALCAIVSTSCVERPELLFSENNAGLSLPDGFSAILVTDTTGRGRHLTVNENGDIYLILRRSNDEGGMVALRDTDGDGTADVKESNDAPSTFLIPTSLVLC